MGHTLLLLTLLTAAAGFGPRLADLGGSLGSSELQDRFTTKDGKVCPEEVTMTFAQGRLLWEDERHVKVRRCNGSQVPKV